MEAIFLKLFNMSIAAGWLILLVTALRLLLKRAPRWFPCALWAAVAIRLVCPFSLESAMSLIPSAQTVSPDIVYAQTPQINSGIQAVNSALNPVIGEALAPSVGASANPMGVLVSVASRVWLFGAAALLIYAVISYIRLRVKVKASLNIGEDIRICDSIQTPFILGLVKPRIYLVSDMDGAQREYVIAHERAHLKRRDHLWKPVGFLLLSVYWFNPLCWLAYILFCRDMELACDERVIRTMEKEDVIAYSRTLLSCSAPRRLAAACPLAFGEVGVKTRIKTVLNYRKPAFWIIITAAVICMVVAVCFLTDPPARAQEIRVYGALYTQEGETVTALPEGSTELGQLIGVTHRTKEHPAENFTAVNLDEKYPGNMLYQSGAEAGVIYLEDLSGFYIPFVREKMPILSLDDAITLSQKGEALTWTDFDGYSYIETGSGLYIRVYEIDDMYSVWMGGGGTDAPPMYIRLVYGGEPEDFVDMRTGDVAGFIDSYRTAADASGVSAADEPERTEGTMDTAAYTDAALNAAVSAAVLPNTSANALDYDYICENHVILAVERIASEKTDGQDAVTVYAMVCVQKFDIVEGRLSLVGGSQLPMALTYDVGGEGEYVLTGHWEPRDGSYYAQDIRDKFPADIVEDALDTQKYALPQMQNCYMQAVGYAQADTEAAIAGLLDTICLSPHTLAVSPQDYINAHPEEYNELLYYGDYALMYICSEFLRGGQPDMRAHIMQSAMKDLLGAEAMELPAGATGQAYFDAWRSAAEKTLSQSGADYVRDNMPRTWLLLQLMGEAQ